MSYQTILRSYIQEALDQFTHENGFVPIQNWETSIMVFAPGLEFDVIVKLQSETRFSSAQAIILHPEIGHYIAPLNGAAQRNIGKIGRRRSIEQMRYDVSHGVVNPLWSDAIGIDGL